jgi:hypothetical protein
MGVSTTAMTPEVRADEESRPLVAIVCTPGDPFGMRVRAELDALGFRTAMVDPVDEPLSRASLEAAARSVHAIAAIRGVVLQGGVEVWIADRVTGKTVLREVRGASASDAGDRESALALRVVELLRASLLETSLPSPPAGEVDATPEITEKLSLPAATYPNGTAVPAPTFRLSLAPAVLVSPGGFGASFSIDVSVAWMPSDHVGVMAFGLFPISHASVKAETGSADLSVLLAGAGARFLFTTRASRWAPTADLGLTAVVMSSAADTAIPGLQRTSSSATALSPFVRLGVAFAATPTARIRADILGGVIAQGASIQFAGQVVATWGQPFVASSLGVDFGWF